MFLATRLARLTIGSTLAFVLLCAMSLAAESLAKRQELTTEQLNIIAGKEYELHVKFRDNLKMRALVDGRVTSHEKAASDQVSNIASTLNLRFEQLIKLPDAKIEKLERRAAEYSKTEQPDLRGMMVARLEGATAARLLHAADTLLYLPEFEFVYLE